MKRKIELERVYEHPIDRVWFALTDSIGVGLAYQSKIGMSEFDDYADLFAEDGGFDIPASMKLESIDAMVVTDCMAEVHGAPIRGAP